MLFNGTTITGYPARMKAEYQSNRQRSWRDDYLDKGLSELYVWQEKGKK